MPDENVHGMWSDDELDTALATLRSDVDTDPARLARARRELVGSAPPQEPTAKRWPRWVASAAAVAAVVAGVLVVQTVEFEKGEPLAPKAAAAELLDSAANRIASGGETVHPGRYLYVGSHDWTMATAADPVPAKSISWLEESLTEQWVPADDRQEWLTRRRTTGQRHYVSVTAAEARRAGIPTDVPAPSSERLRCGWSPDGCVPGDWEVPNQEFMASLPRDPDKLYTALRRGSTIDGHVSEHDMLYVAGRLLSSGRVPADLRAALYRVLGKLPHIKVTEKFANVDGRTGTAFGIAGREWRYDVIIDPATGKFIGERDVATKGFADVPPGTVVEYTSVVTDVVDHQGEKPAG